MVCVFFKLYRSTLPWGKRTAFAVLVKICLGFGNLQSLIYYITVRTCSVKGQKTSSTLNPFMAIGISWFWSLGQLSGWGRQLPFTLCNVYLFLVSYKELAKANPVTEGNATLNHMWSESPHNISQDPGFYCVQTAQQPLLITDVKTPKKVETHKKGGNCQRYHCLPPPLLRKMHGHERQHKCLLAAVRKEKLKNF